MSTTLDIGLSVSEDTVLELIGAGNLPEQSSTETLPINQFTTTTTHVHQVGQRPSPLVMNEYVFVTEESQSAHHFLLQMMSCCNPSENEQKARQPLVRMAVSEAERIPITMPASTHLPMVVETVCRNWADILVDKVPNYSVPLHWKDDEEYNTWPLL